MRAILSPKIFCRAGCAIVTACGGVLALFERLEAAHRRAPAPAAAAGPAAAMGPPAAAGAGGLVASGGISGALAAVEGTALVTLADAFKYDGVLAKELIKLVECSPSAPSRFCLLLLFTLSQQHKQEGPVRNLLKHLVSAGFQWDATRAASAWLSSLPALPRPGGQQLRAALLAAVRCGSGDDSDPVLWRNVPACVPAVG
ncbi:hypothetical protein CHLRE_12g491951v5 [Chlamydomonas reinhardtii]|uniref:Uncharacterized protein n=1 Tax=Chlamydomonas reinhardtii TaxID=3055 RepID=A0A2K3D227_CHLRE|nr:uncharacterized protein CHLRE_12g491951v5 [Chlamydomonas reinhardtii]PNW74584.1 hypothetical protein CHLRE_12g491951v5 [Chlamydomonas reinhardtii]